MRKNHAIILEELQKCYPDAGPELHFSNPYETLVAVMLSAQCTDKQVNKVTPALFERYPTVQSMAEASIEDVYPMVKSCGFRTKATNIVHTCQLLMLHHDGQVPDTMADLIALPGVGQKTANVVMATAFGIPAIAVDTHVFRVSNRLGLANAKNVQETERQLMKSIPKKDWIDAHHWLIFHGRRICHAQRPTCDQCSLFPVCKSQGKPTKTAKPKAVQSKNA